MPVATAALQGAYGEGVRWRGRVTSVGEKTFHALLEDLDGRLPDREVELYVDGVPLGDRHMVREGALFYWSIRHGNTLDGQWERPSDMQFRQQPRWSADDQRRAENWSARMKHLVDGDWQDGPEEDEDAGTGSAQTEASAAPTGQS